MSNEKKTVHKTKKNAKGQTVLDGSISLKGKESPTATPQVKASKKVSNTPEVVQIPFPPYPSLKTGKDLDWQQDYEDYIFGLEDMWLALEANVEPDLEVVKYLEKKAAAVATNLFGRKEVTQDLIRFSSSTSKYKTIPEAILLEVLTEDVRKTILEHKPAYDVSAVEELHELIGYSYLYCSICKRVSYPCSYVRETQYLDEFDPTIGAKLRAEQVTV